jgi:hypothetical protein
MAIDLNDINIENLMDNPPSDNIFDEVPKDKPKPKSNSNRTKLSKSLSNMYGTIGVMVTMFDPHCGQVILSQAESMADSLEVLAKENDAVRRVLEGIAQTTAWGGVISAHAPLIFAITMHHLPTKKSPSNIPETETESTYTTSSGVYTPPPQPESMNDSGNTAP